MCISGWNVASCDQGISSSVAGGPQRFARFRAVPISRTRGWSYSPSVRLFFAMLIVAGALSACGSGSGERRDEVQSTVRRSPAAILRIERCVDGLLQASTMPDASKEEARRYVRNTYCVRFEKQGWIYEDGALSIAAQRWLDEGATCATSREGEPMRTVSCEEERRAAGGRMLDCALLHVVRRSEVRDYIERIRSNGLVECDDGSALDKLGIP
jgi:hypothetical protein